MLESTRLHSEEYSCLWHSKRCSMRASAGGRGQAAECATRQCRSERGTYRGTGVAAQLLDVAAHDLQHLHSRSSVGVSYLCPHEEQARYICQHSKADASIKHTSMISCKALGNHTQPESASATKTEHAAISACAHGQTAPGCRPCAPGPGWRGTPTAPAPAPAPAPRAPRPRLRQCDTQGMMSAACNWHKRERRAVISAAITQGLLDRVSTMGSE